MRKSVFLLIFFIFPLLSDAQQTHQYTQYIFNQFGHNPAVAGSSQCIELRFGGRRQWLAMDGTPLTAFASVYGRLGSKKKTIVKGYHGLGLYLQRDDQGPISRTTLYPGYAYHIRLRTGLNLGLGVFAGMQQYRFDPTRLDVPNLADPLLQSAGSAVIVPDISAGLWLYSKSTYWGLSALQLWRKPIKGFGHDIGMDARITPHFILTGGYQSDGNSDYYIVPSFMLKYTPGSIPSLDLNLMMNLRQNLDIGLSYRLMDAVAGIVRLRVMESVFLSYSYDFTTSKLRWGSKNTHEVLLALKFCGRNGGGDRSNSCPAYQ